MIDPELPLAVLLDRDGVIVEPVLDPRSGTHESPLCPQDVRLVPGAAAAGRRLTEHGILVNVVSNQPSAAKGNSTMRELVAVHQRAVDLLAAQGTTLDGWNYCYHHPDGSDPELTLACDCRKPMPGLLIGALARDGIAPEHAWMIGDADTDVVAGIAAGTSTALIEHPLTAHRRSDPHARPDVRISSLDQFVEWLLAGRSAEAVPARSRFGA